MKTKIIPSHIAILVPSVKKAAEYLNKFKFQIGPEEVWDSEGTKKIYIEREAANSLLLIEPIKPGAYQRALEKRGPGLHHLAIDVKNLEDYLISLSGSGWLLHPMSIKTIKQSQTAYLARPGFPGLIEVQERQKLIERPLFVEAIKLKMDSLNAGLLKFIGLNSVVCVTQNSTELILSGKTVKLQDLIG